MKLLRTAVILVGILLSVPALPAGAAGAETVLTIHPRWGLAGTQGTWTPYQVDIRNNSGADLAGDLYLLPLGGPQGPRGTAGALPPHRLPVSVPRGGTRSEMVYVIDSAFGYRAQLRERSGRLVAQADPTPGMPGSAAVAVLSDLPQAEQKIAAPLAQLTKVQAAVTSFGSVQSFPTNAVRLSGLSGLILDEFDSAALSQAQVQALRDFVGLGGFLIEAGGPSWRRTLLPLPPDLLPLQPQVTVSEPLSSLVALAGLAPTDASTQVAAGQLRGGRVALAAADGTPLMIGAPYGAGQVLELAFDPFSEPFSDRIELPALAWSQAISRALSGVQGPGRTQSYGGYGAPIVSSAGEAQAVAGPGGWAPGYGTGTTQISQILTDTPAAANPPVGLLGGLLVGYVLLTGLLSFLVLSAAGRRDLMWVAVPAVAILFTAGAYAAGLASRGAGFYVTQVEIQRLAPGGAVQTYTFANVYPPQRGDVEIDVTKDTLVSTAASPEAGGGADQALVTDGTHPSVLLEQVAIWNPRSVQGLSVTHPTSAAAAQPGLEAHLRLANGRVTGTVSNHTAHTIRDLSIIGSSSNLSRLAVDLAPGATAAVDAPLTAGTGTTSTSPGNPSEVALSGAADSEAARSAVLRLAGSQALGSAAGDLALVGLTDPSQGFQVDGARPTRSGLAAVAETVRLEASDSLAPARARLVSTFMGTDGMTLTDAYDFDLPTGAPPPIALSYELVEAGQFKSAGTARSVEVYEWASQTWRALPVQQAPYRGPQSATLSPSEIAGGTVRVRVHETSPFQAQLSLVQP